MTNKVKPFFIRITDDMTPQIALEVKDKCTNKNVSGDFHFNPSDIKRWKYLGVCSQDGLCYSDFTENFYGNAQEITLDQLDEWLGLEVKQEWKNGDECIYQGKPWHFVSILSDEFHGTAVIFERISEKLKQVDLSKLEKPETPEQKAERERLSAAYDLYCARCDAVEWDCKYSFDEFISEEDALIGWLAVVDLTNYCKQ